jgi:hypothetical protein
MIVPLNISTQEGTILANILECKLDSLPITYLGITLHRKKKIKTNDWDFLINKVEKN